MPNMIKLIAIILSLVPSLAFADSPSLPYSHAVPSADGRFLFVMIAPNTLEDDISNWNDEKAGEIEQIRNSFIESGLYLNDGSNIPVWTVDWYAQTIIPLNDGIHLVRRGPWARSSADEAVSFFANGIMSETYRVRDLVAIPFLMPRTVSHFTWQSKAQLDNVAKTYTIETKHGEQYLFDVETGKVKSSSSPFPLLGFALFVGIATVGCIFWRRKQH